MSGSITQAGRPDHDVVVIGAGFSGIGAAIKLDEAGFGDYLVLEAGSGVGGAWRWNTYPGVAVDIPSFSYQFSFEQRRDWSRVYAPGSELRAYAEDCVDKYGVREKIRFNTEVTGAEFDEGEHLWRLSTGGGEEITARCVIGATGVFNKPQPPEIPGYSDFAGEVMHTARWNHDIDLKGKRVGIIGTGASAVQVIPAIAREVGSLVVFQRTAIWCLPKPDRRIGHHLRTALEKVPGVNRAARAAGQAFVEATFTLPAHFAGKFPFVAIGERNARKHLRDQVKDPEVRAKLTPDYSLGCKRPSFHNHYLRTFNRENVELETTPIEAITDRGVRVQGGREHELDVLIAATGFKVFEKGNMPPFPIQSGGVDLEQWWDENRYQAYEGVSVPGFPNMFTILGPYGFNGSSYFQLIENQMRHITRLLRRAREGSSTRIEVTREANERYWRKMLGRRDDQIFFQGTCGTANSYYFDRHGDVPFRASTSPEVQWRSTHFPLEDYRFSRVESPVPAGA